MTSLAIWCEGSQLDDSCKCNYDVHFNLWTNVDPYTLDIGIKLKYFSKLDNICLYFPFGLNKSNIFDLGGTITQTKEMLNAVFNESYTKEETEEPKHIAIKENQAVIFYVYKLDVENDIDIHEKYEGSILTIKLKEKKSLKDGAEYYFRIRITDKNLSKLVEKRKNISSIFNALLVENDFIDFRLNDWRSLHNESLIEHVRDNKVKNYGMKKVNFFVMTNGDTEIKSNTKKSERKLETGVWEKYLDNLKKDSVILAHQWQKLPEENNNNFNSFNAYLRFKKQWFNFQTVAWYLLIIILINLLSSLIWELIQFLTKAILNMME